MWMNEIEIEQAVRRISKPSLLVKGAKCLQEFCHLINSISDGWAYWSYGTKCSNDLQEIVAKGQWPINQLGFEDYSNVKPAMRKIVRFLKRCDQTKDNPTVIAFIERWKLA